MHATPFSRQSICPAPAGSGNTGPLHQPRSLSIFAAAVGVACILLAGTSSALAVRTDKADLNTFAQFSPGDLDGLSLDSEGHLELAPAITNLTTLTDPVIWCAIQDKHGNIFLGTGNQGKVYKINSKGELSAFFAPNEVMVHALALDSKGRLYAATSPNGRVYRLDADGRAEVFCNPGETYVWAMITGKDGALYLATGNHGKILRVSTSDSAPAKAEVYFETEETHITALAWDKEGNLLAGTSPHGYLYRIEKAKHGFVVFNSGDTEIKQIAVSPEGMIYASTFVESGAQKSSGSTASATAIILGSDSGMSDTAAKSAAAASSKGRSPEDMTPGLPGQPDASGGGSQGGSTGSARGAIYSIDAAGFHERYWTASDDAIFSMILLHDGSLLVGTGDKGRIYSIASPVRWKLLQKTTEGARISALLPDTAESKQYYAATSHPGWLCRLDFAFATNGTYTSKVFDAKQKSLWGKLHPEGDTPAGTRLQFSARSGNTDKPEKTWSEWSTPASIASEITLSNPPARYLQFRVAMSRDTKSASTTPQLRRLQFYYQNQNAAPVVSRVKVYADGFGVSKMVQPPIEAPINFDQLLSVSSRVGGPVLPRPPLKVNRSPGLCTVVWEASDPNQDQLNYSVAIRAETEKQWTTLVSKTQDNFFSFDSTGYQPGRYFIKVTASDEPSNTAATARTADEISEAFLIDNSPPALALKDQKIEKDHARFSFDATDNFSVISSASYSIDGADDVSIRPDNLVFDSIHETFTIELSGLAKGAHSLLIHVQNEAKLTSVLKLNFESP